MIDGIGRSQAGRPDAARGLERSEAAGRSADAAARRDLGGTANPLADMAASGPPVDGGKVAALRAAIAEGRYPVDPERIAAAMLALDLPGGEGA